MRAPRIGGSGTPAALALGLALTAACAGKAAAPDTAWPSGPAVHASELPLEARRTLHAELLDRVEGIRGCELQRNPEDPFLYTLALAIAPDGRVADVDVVLPPGVVSLGGAESCMQRRAGKWRFTPLADPAPVHLQIRVNFARSWDPAPWLVERDPRPRGGR